MEIEKFCFKINPPSKKKMNASYEYDYPCTAYQSNDQPTDVSIIAADHPVQPVSVPACVFVTCPPTPDRLHAHTIVHECVRVCFFPRQRKTI